MNMILDIVAVANGFGRIAFVISPGILWPVSLLEFQTRIWCDGGVLDMSYWLVPGICKCHVSLPKSQNSGHLESPKCPLEFQPF